MAFNGTGTFVRLYNWVSDAAASINITASRMDAETDGIANGLSNCITRDGQGKPTAAINWNGQNLTNINQLGVTGTATFAAGVTGITDLTTIGNTILGDAATDTLNVGAGGIIKDGSGQVGFNVTPGAIFDAKTGANSRVRWSESAGASYIDTLNLAASGWVNKVERATSYQWFTGASPTTGLTLDVNQNLGLGTATPTDSSAFGGKVIDIAGPVYARQSGTPANYASLGTVGATAYVAIGGAIPLVFLLNSSEKLRITAAGVIQDGAANELGFKGLPAASVTTGAFAASDRGKCVFATGPVTVPNATMSNTDVVVIQDTTGAAQTITATITTLRKTGTALTGNRTLAAYGRCSIVFVSGTLGFISGDVT